MKKNCNANIIIYRLLREYNCRKKINMSLKKYLLRIVDNDFELYREIIGLIPSDLYIDPLDEYIFLTKDEFIERYNKQIKNE